MSDKKDQGKQFPVNEEKSLGGIGGLRPGSSQDSGKDQTPNSPKKDD